MNRSANRTRIIELVRDHPGIRSHELANVYPRWRRTRKGLLALAAAGAIRGRRLIDGGGWEIGDGIAKGNPRGSCND